MSERTGRTVARGHCVFLILAATWNLGAGIRLMTLREGVGVGSAMPRARVIGGVVLAFGVLYAALARRPVRALLIVSAIAKLAGGASGVFGWLRGERDAITAISLADAAWMPGFVLLARRGRDEGRGGC